MLDFFSVVSLADLDGRVNIHGIVMVMDTGMHTKDIDRNAIYSTLI